MKHQTTNPGGRLAPDEIIGRDKLIGRLWKILERRHLYITGERRMGKTSIIRDKMANENRPGWRMVYLDVSRAASPLEFVEHLQAIGNQHLDNNKRTISRFRLAWAKLSGAEVGTDAFSLKIPASLTANWKILLESLLHDLATMEGRTILAFDELPLMLDAIRRNSKTDGEIQVIEILDTLRAVRQTEPDIRMIYTGSLGLHHILTDLRISGYQNDPTNDMTTVAVEPLETEDATDLGQRLLEGEGVPCNDVAVSAGYLATVTDGMPYYIQHLVEGMVIDGFDGNPESIDILLANRLNDANDPWHLRYYRERITTHYPLNLQGTTLALLDYLATRDTPCSLEEAVVALNPQTTDRSPETVRAALHLLGLDNYLHKTEIGYSFRHSFIVRVWRTIRS